MTKKRSPDEARREGFEQGGIIVVVDGDAIHTLWCGSEPGRDYLFVHVEDELGRHYLMGRFREHSDGRMFGSADARRKVQLRVTPGEKATGEFGELFAQAIQASALGSYGTVPELHAFHPEIREGEHPSEALHRVLVEEVPDKIPGWRTSKGEGSTYEEAQAAGEAAELAEGECS